MKIALMKGIVAVEGMMMMIVRAIAGAEDTGAIVLATEEDGGVGAEVEVLAEGDREVLLGKVVRKGVPRLSNGTGRKKSKKMQITGQMTITAMGT